MPVCEHCGATIDTADTFCQVCGTKAGAPETDASEYDDEEPLLIEWIIRRTRFDRLVATLGLDVYPPYLLVFLGIVVAFLLLPLYSYVTVGYHTALVNPLRPLVISVGLLFAVASIRYMTRNYEKAIDNLDLQRREGSVDRDKFSPIISFRIKRWVFGLFVVLYYLTILVPTVVEGLGINTGLTIFAALSGRGLQTLVQAEGVVTTVTAQLILVPLVNVPIALDFIFVFFGLNFALPRKLSRADIEPFFHDPRNMGGFNAVGHLLKRSYYLYTGVVLIYFVVGYGPVLFSPLVDTPRSAPGMDVVVIFTAMWLVGLASVSYSFFKVHRIMLAKKEQRLQQIEADIKEIIDNPFDIRSSRVVNRGVMETKERQLREVKSTKTYPATFTMWWQLGLSVLLPQALQLATQTVM